MRNWWGAGILAGLLVAASGCDAGANGDGASPRAAGGTAGSGVYQVDMDEIFPAGAGRDILLNNCQSCHTWVPVVVLQMNEEEWARSSREHRARVEALSDSEFETLYAYLSSTFTPDRPVPELPSALLESWTTY